MGPFDTDSTDLLYGGAVGRRSSYSPFLFYTPYFYLLFILSPIILSPIILSPFYSLPPLRARRRQLANINDVSFCYNQEKTKIVYVDGVAIIEATGGQGVWALCGEECLSKTVSKSIFNPICSLLLFGVVMLRYS